MSGDSKHEVRFRPEVTEDVKSEIKRELVDNSSNTESADRASQASSEDEKADGNISLWDYLHGELRRGYYLENDEQRYEDRREKFYMFFKIPKEFEKFQFYGIFQCADAFLFVFTLLPLRFALSICLMCINLLKRFFNSLRKQRSPVITNRRLLQPAEICDLLKGLIVIIVALAATFLDTSVLYHVVKTQSVIKLYIFFNMLEVADRLFSNFGQDIIDALFWTATEPRGREGDGRRRFGVFLHFILAVMYVFLHCCLVMLQAVALNVAINSQSKGLLAIMMSNNFVELKGMVFKKFEKNNLFQMCCSDVRERFHYIVLLFVVVLQTMKEYNWQPEPLYELLPSCIYVLAAEVVVDWVKHAFVTRFNDIHYSVYNEYITYLAYDVASSKLKNAYSDHSDLVARRMAFIPLPLGALVLRIVLGSVSIRGTYAIFLSLLGYLVLFSCKVAVNLYLLGRACVLIERHRGSLNEKKPAPRLCASLPSSRRQSMDDLKRDPNIPQVKSEPQSTNPSVSSSLADIRDHAELASQSMNEAPIFAESAVDISTLGVQEDVLGECVDPTGNRLLTDLKNRGRSVSTGMLPGLPMKQVKKEL